MIAERLRGVPASETLLIAAKAKELKEQGIDIVSFTVGEPDFDTPAHIKQAAIDAIESGFTKYTDPSGILELRKAICAQIKEDLNLDYSPSQVVVTNGSKQALYNFFQAALNKGDQILIPSPYWVSYPAMVQLASAVPKILKTSPKTNFKITPEQLKKAIRPRTKAIIINSPSNPTGMAYTKEELEALGEVLEDKDIWIVSDDAYSKILYDGLQFHSLAQLSQKLFSKTLIFNTCSKSYAMTGWRIGYVAGPDEIIKPIAIIQSQSTSGANAIAQKAAVKAFTSPQVTVTAMTKEFEQRRNVAIEELKKIKGIKNVKPDGAFYLFPDFSKYYGKKFNGKVMQGSQDLSNYFLEEAKVATIPGAGFGADKHIRLSYATSIENIRKGIGRIKEALLKLE